MANDVSKRDAADVFTQRLTLPVHSEHHKYNIAAMAEHIRWGLMSTAAINVALLGPFRRSQRSKLVAVASRKLDRAQIYAKKHDIPKAYGSYQELLDDSDVDAIYNPLPNTMHCEWSVKAAEAGKHVLCEKPIVTRLDELDQIESAAKAHQVTIFEAYSYLHHPQFQMIYEMIGSGRLGRLHLITCRDAFSLPPEDRSNIRLNPQLGGGSLWDVGVYPVTFGMGLANAGLPTQVWASQLKNDTDVDIAMSGQMRFSNGVVVQISCGFRSPPRRGALIIGDEGMLDVDDHLTAQEPGEPPVDSHMVFTDRSGNQETIRIPAVDIYLGEVEAMEACVLDGAAPAVPISLSRQFLKTVLALYESAETGQLVEPD